MAAASSSSPPDFSSRMASSLDVADAVADAAADAGADAADASSSSAAPATSIRPIEALSVHRIQSGQVIVDLQSAVKELVENAVDAGATSVEVRFRNQGLDALEVADNGAGIAPADHAAVALKHHTSKLRGYDDLTRLTTFGFRGEALSSLCAVADVHLVTATEADAPRATRLDFTTTGALATSSMVAAARGTTVTVENLFAPLPVRRRELARNIKREYTKVLGLLQAYACISTSARLVVSNLSGSGSRGGPKRSIVFATKAGQTTRENIANVFGTRTTASLIPLDLSLEMRASAPSSSSSNVRVTGHVSKPVVGEGRAMADRQMFFVNGRPCGLPQVAKAINEVYRSFNLTQAPFVFANLELDTEAYDVNVSPDKRTILLHEQGALLNSLKASLLALFESQEQSVPQNHALQTLPSAFSAFKRPSTTRQPTDLSSQVSEEAEAPERGASSDDVSHAAATPRDLPSSIGTPGLVQKLFAHRPQADPGEDGSSAQNEGTTAVNEPPGLEEDGPNQTLMTAERQQPTSDNADVYERREDGVKSRAADEDDLFVQADESFQNEMEVDEPELPIPSSQTIAAKNQPGIVQNAFDRMRPLRIPLQEAVITIGDKTMTKTIGGPSGLRWTMGSEGKRSKVKSRRIPNRTIKSSLQNSLRAFAAPGSQMELAAEDADEIEEDGETDDSEDLEEEEGPPRKVRIHQVEAESDEESDEGDAPTQTPDGRAPSQGAESSNSDGEYIDEETSRAREDERVNHLIRDAEAKEAQPSAESLKHASRMLKGGGRETTLKLSLPLTDTTESVLKASEHYHSFLRANVLAQTDDKTSDEDLAVTAEEKLSLTISKEDFKEMHISGQFNLGFIVALRKSSSPSSSATATDAENRHRRRRHDELFIIDQHASDEKFNFERLQATTQVQKQPLVHHQRLDLTAVEEEILAENQATLLRNGFEVDFDDSGEWPVGRRCTLVSLPMSREVTFSTADLEELIALIAENPGAAVPLPTTVTSNDGKSADGKSADDDESLSFLSPVLRPSKVRKMFAMRACRSSIMIGRTLERRQMRALVDNMGRMERPWNCPHGRPTMRHLYSFGGGGSGSDSRGWTAWSEGDGVRGMAEDADFANSELGSGGAIDWAAYLGGVEGARGREEDESDDESSKDSEHDHENSTRDEDEADSADGDGNDDDDDDDGENT